MRDHRVAPRIERVPAFKQRLVPREVSARSRRSFVTWILLAALLIGLEGARIVCGDQALFALMQVR